jgi:hypothetical protein
LQNLSTQRRLLVLGLASLTVACDIQQEPVTMAFPGLKADLDKLAASRVLFAHQSVGRDIIDGLRDLAKQNGVNLNIAAIDGDKPADGRGLFDFHVGKNGDTGSKIKHFEDTLAARMANGFEVAVLKLCYEDVQKAVNPDPQKLIDTYAESVKRIRAAHPKTIIVHATSPLRSDPPGWKTAVKRVIGRDTWEDADNALRKTYNDAFRKRFAGAPLFDVAAVESTKPDGSPSRFGKGDFTVPTLAQALTRDGGHLNELGKRVVAAAFARSVAMALG